MRQVFVFIQRQVATKCEAGVCLHSKAGCHKKRGRYLPQNEAGIRWRLCARHTNRLFLVLVLLASSEAACQAPVKRRFIERSGRRDSNSRQPAWKAGTLPLSYSRISRGARTRTADLLLPKQARYQLRHTPLTYLNFSMILVTCQVLF